MFKNVLIFFSTLFFFSSLSFEINSLTKDQLLKTKQKFNTVNSLISKHRIKRSKINIEKYKKSRQVFNEIKKKNWNEAKKLAKNNEVLIKIIDWHFIHQNNLLNEKIHTNIILDVMEYSTHRKGWIPFSNN